MPLTVPTLSQSCQAAATAIATRLPGADATPPKSVLGVLAKIWGGGVDGLFGAVQTIANNIIYDTADIDSLVRYASMWGIYREPPTAATGTVTFTGGTGTIPAGAVIARSDGIQYTLNADVILANATGSGTVTCTSAGSVTNTDPGGVLQLSGAISGVSSTVTVGPSGLGGGADIETPQSLLNRLLLRIRQTPQGGSDSDYQEWALAVPGVTRAWVFPGWQGTGTVGLTFMMDGRPDPVPLAADVAAVQAAINAVRPVGAQTFVFAPTPVPLNPTIHLTPSNTATQAAVEAALAALIATCTPGGTYEVLGVQTAGGLLYLTHIEAAISGAAGVVDFTLPSLTANVQVSSGEITTLGQISWV